MAPNPTHLTLLLDHDLRMPRYLGRVLTHLDEAGERLGKALGDYLRVSATTAPPEIGRRQACHWDHDRWIIFDALQDDTVGLRLALRREDLASVGQLIFKGSVDDAFILSRIAESLSQKAVAAVYGAEPWDLPALRTADVDPISDGAVVAAQYTLTFDSEIQIVIELEAVKAFLTRYVTFPSVPQENLAAVSFDVTAVLGTLPAQLSPMADLTPGSIVPLGDLDLSDVALATTGQSGATILAVGELGSEDGRRSVRLLRTPEMEMPLIAAATMPDPAAALV